MKEQTLSIPKHARGWERPGDTLREGDAQTHRAGRSAENVLTIEQSAAERYTRANAEARHVAPTVWGLAGRQPDVSALSATARHSGDL